MKCKKGRKVDWQQLPYDVLSLITNKLTELKDFIRWSFVCRSWRSAFIQNLRHNRIRLPHQPPLLLLQNKSNQGHQPRSFYSITEGRFYDIRVPLIRHIICHGSTHGWLIGGAEEDYQVILINPFMSFNNEITLPVMETRHLLHKVMLSANPLSSSSYQVIALYGAFRNKKLAFFKPGDTEWTTLNPLTNIRDVICYNHRQLIAVNQDGEVFDCDTNKRVAPPLKAVFSCSRYLVESSRELWQVLKHNGFDVYRLNNRYNWTKMKNLKGCALFLGGNTLMSVSRSEFPELKSNAIYFADAVNIGRKRYHMGVFDIVDRTITPHFPVSCTKYISPVPIWVNPMIEEFDE